MNILEREIEDLIYEAATEHTYELNCRGLYAPYGATWFRQMNLGKYGIADLIAITLGVKHNGTRRIDVDIYELKKEIINVATLLQAVGYGKALQQLVPGSLKRTTVSYNFHLVGKRVERGGNFLYLTDLVNNVFVYEYSIDFLDGMEFKKIENYRLTQPELPPLSRFSNELRGQIDDALDCMVAIRKPKESIEDLPF